MLLVRSFVWCPGPGRASAVDRELLGRQGLVAGLEGRHHVAVVDGEAQDEAEGDRSFALAIEHAVSDRERADFHSARGVRGHGPGLATDLDRALALYPLHGPSLYRRAGLIANAVGRRSSARGRIAYWCLADIYRTVAAASGDDRIADAARRAAAQYERAAPSEIVDALGGPAIGAEVAGDLGAYGRCTTVVR